MEYNIDFSGGHEPRTAQTMDEALAIIRTTLGIPRAYTGAEYETEDGQRAIDVWSTEADAIEERGTPADAVITQSPKWEREFTARARCFRGANGGVGIPG